MELWNFDILVHALMGVMFFVTAWLVRSTCQHTGWLPHPVQQIAISVVLIYMEAVASVAVVG